MMNEEDNFSPFYDENGDSEKRRLIPSPQSVIKTERKSSSKSSSPRYSIDEDEGLRLNKWREASAKEKELLEYVKSGDIQSVTEFLNLHKEFNINAAIDVGGSERETPLHAAVVRGDEAMVNLLLAMQFIEVGDCVLTAAQDGRANIVMLLLEHVYNATNSTESEDCGCNGSERFPDNTTPLMVAAINGHTGLIRQLLKRNHQIKMPHPPSCFCELCRERLDPDHGLRASMDRLRVYEALCSPAYICVAADDPILRAFQLYRELRACAAREAALSTKYLDLANSMRTFAVELLAECRTSSEVDLVLTRPRGFKSKHTLVPMPRLLLAMETGQKEFVAHSNTQHVLYTRWLGESPEWGGSQGVLLTLAHVLGRLFLLPMLAVLSVVAPSTAWARRFSSPVNRLVNHVASYLLFLTLVFVQANVNKKTASHGPARSGVEGLLILYLVGIEWNLMRMMYLVGFKRFFKHLWNCYDMATIQLFWAWLFFFVHASRQNETMERKYWPSLHPALVSEGFLAFATILAFGRLLFLCQLHSKLGPMQVSLGKMTNDLAQCIVIFLIILVSFSAGMSTLFQYYDGMIQEQPGTGVKLIQPSSFVGLMSTLKTLFWGVFGLTPPEYAVVVIENLPDNSVNAHNFTQNVGAACFALYMLLTTVMIINVLVAKMTNTYQKVVDNVEIEWTFGKTEVYLTFMQQTVLPPPLNLIPTKAGVCAVFKWLKSLSAKKVLQDVEDVEVANEQYTALMDVISARYHSAKENLQDHASPSHPAPPPPSPREPVPSTLDANTLAATVTAQLVPVLQQHVAALREELLKSQASQAASKSKR